MDFQSEKSFGKLRLRAFQPYHQTLCILKHVEDVEDNQCKHMNRLLELHCVKYFELWAFELTVHFKHEMIGFLPNIHSNFELSGTSN